MPRPVRIVTATTREPVTTEMLRGQPGAPGAPGQPGAAGKDATLAGVLSTGTAVAAQIPAGGEVTVTVELRPPLASKDYVASVTLGGTSTLLGQVDYRGQTQKTPSSITVRLRNNGLLVPSGAVTVDVIAARTP